MDAILGVGLDVARQITVTRDDDLFGIDGRNDTGLIRDHHDFGVTSDPLFNTGAHEGRLGLEEGHALALHVGSHQRAIRIVVLKERNHARSDRNHLLGRDVHVVDVSGGYLEELAVFTDGDLAHKVPLVVELGVSLRDDLGLLLVGGEVVNLVGYAAVLRETVRRLDEAKLVNAGVGREGIDETDIGTLGRLDRANATVVRRMNVADFETGTFAIETAWPERRKSTLVRDLRERVDLIHELGELGTREEIADDGRQRLRVDQLLRGDRVNALVIHRHALTHETLGAAEADAALIGEQLADGADATGTQVIDVIDDAHAALQANEIFRRGDDVAGLQDALLKFDLQTELLVNLVATNAAEVVTLRIKEETLEQGFRVRGSRRLAGTKAFVDFLEGFFFVAGRIFFQRTDEGTFVHGGINDAQRRDVVFLERTHDRLREGLERAREHDALLGIDGVFYEDERGNVFEIEGLGDLQILDVVEKIQQIDVRAITDSAKERRDEELAATTAAIEIDVKQIVIVELHFEPRAAVGNDAERMERFAVRMRRNFEGDARRTVELRNHDTLGTVNDEGTALSHHGDFAHVDIFVLDEVFFAEAELHVERHGISDPLAEALQLGALGVAKIIGHVLERQALVVAENRKHLAENGLKALRLALLFGNALLQKVQVGRNLNLDEVRRLDDFAELAEVNAFRVGAVGHGSSR